MTTPTTEQLWNALRVLFGPDIQAASLTVLIKTDGGHTFDSWYMPVPNEVERGDKT